jgi:hypothetical protein
VVKKIKKGKVNSTKRVLAPAPLFNGKQSNIQADFRHENFGSFKRLLEPTPPHQLDVA